MPSRDYPVRNGTKLCKVISNAIVKFIEEFETRPTRVLISLKPRHSPHRVDGVPVRTRRDVPKKIIRLEAK
jgi:hypothetical protein